MSSDKKIIYGNGEHYIEPINKSNMGRSPNFIRSYEEARARLITQIEETKDAISSLDKGEYLEEAVVFCIRLDASFIAKSYHPIRLIEESPIELIGSQKWSPKKSLPSKLLFVRIHEKNFPQMVSLLNRAPKDLTLDWMNDVRKIEEISLLQPEEKILGLEHWENGKVELVLHPLSSYSDKALVKAISKLKKAGAVSSSIRFSQYERGLAFISAEISKQDFKTLGSLNILRTAHSLGKMSFPEMRSSTGADAPKPSTSTVPSPIKVGIFDGGTDPLNPLLLNHVRETSLTTELSINEGLFHGSAVAGCVLYGPLNSYKPGAILPSPSVSVESYRVFPTADADDPELYEIIDHIEKIVAERQDIRVYNLSFGPEGPIVDNHIRRFTYALDRLAYKHNVLFTVAVGNAGQDGPTAGRIQSPADGINVFGIGAHTHDINKKTGLISNVAASYTCIGPGREGCKVKPDVSAYGGCSNHPIALVNGTTHGHLSHSKGTSFSSPIVAGNAAELLGRCPQLSPLQTRVLIINRSEREEKAPHVQLGHGVVLARPDEMLECSKNRVTILYNGSLSTKKYAKILIPFVKGNLRGTVNLRWTIGVLTKPDIENVDEYSSVCIEDTFYPHSEKYKYSLIGANNKVIKSKALNLLNQRAEADKLLQAGWKKPKFPITKVGVGYRATENARRNHLKWDTIVDRQVSMLANGLHDPFLIVHAMSRNDYLEEHSDVKYGVAVTVEFPNYKGDLYAEIGKIYSKLEPVSVRSINQILLQT